jgi:cell division protein FtsZ
MIHFDIPKDKSSILKVIGVGGGGSNAVNYMYSQNIEGVDFIICNTDSQALTLSSIPNKIQLGPHLTQGLGAGANPAIGRQATEESLEEIKRILEVNTKMAFITAGMGGGTGTGGAPIISKICKELGILTVGIVTLPFAYEGKKRQLQAEEGIGILKQYVDTLLVISNDKLRHQFGNLKMREAFEKADNVLATAAKCITDVITCTGQINVDFADVCTVMKNGGVAILGSASASGENRAQVAIEEALNSPLLNDSEIRGAKWILININSAEGQHEFTMDEVEIIQNHLLSQAGEHSDVILGLGYDNNLGENIGITLIATGFEHKDPFAKATPKKQEVKKEEKIVMVLGEQEEEKTEPVKLVKVEETYKKIEETYNLAPTLVDELAEIPLPAEVDLFFKDEILEEEPVILLELKPEEDVNRIITNEKPSETTVDKISLKQNNEELHSTSIYTDTNSKESINIFQTDSPMPAASGGYLARPSNIYAETNKEVSTSTPNPEKPVSAPIVQKLEDEFPPMQLVVRDEIPAADEPLAHQTIPSLTTPAEETAMQDEAEDQKRRAASRLAKLRNLSFNINAADPNNEFETVPAYIRRNMELYNTVSPAENFYSNYTVDKDENNQTNISTINTFLDGKKPD